MEEEILTVEEAIDYIQALLVQSATRVNYLIAMGLDPEALTDTILFNAAIDKVLTCARTNLWLDTMIEEGKE